MPTFPTATPSYAGFTAGHTLAADTHAAQHNAEQADIIALANKVGTGASTPASGLVLTASGTGTSSWAQVNLTTMVSGVLPVANGGTGTTSTTGTGSVVFGTSPTISGASLTNSPTLTTPTIANFTNANHNHQNTAGGGQISNGGISNVGYEKFINPYKFSVYRNAAQTPGAGGIVQFDTKIFDTGSNVDTVTNKGRFTAPIAGFYFFSTCVSFTATGANQDVNVRLNKNGSLDTILGGYVNMYAAGTNDATSSGSLILQLAANDYVEISTSSTLAIVAGLSNNIFTGFLISAT